MQEQTKHLFDGIVVTVSVEGDNFIATVVDGNQRYRYAENAKGQSHGLTVLGSLSSDEELTPWQLPDEKTKRAMKAAILARRSATLPNPKR